MKKTVFAVAATLTAVIIVAGAIETNKPNQAAPVVQAQAASQPTAATADPAHHRFAVGLGSFPDDATAQAWVDKLKAAGVPAYIETVTQDGGPTVTELRGGPFDSRADASAAIAKIRESGLFSGDASPASAPAPVAQDAPASDASAQIGEPAVMVKGSSSNCAYEGTMAGNAAKYADVEDERSRLRDARSGIPDAMYAANIKAIFENPDISKLNNEDVADLAEKACLNGTDLSTYKAPQAAARPIAASELSDASGDQSSQDENAGTDWWIYEGDKHRCERFSDFAKAKGLPGNISTPQDLADSMGENSGAIPGHHDWLAVTGKLDNPDNTILFFGKSHDSCVAVAQNMLKGHTSDIK